MVSIGPKIEIKGESSYRLAMRNIISETKTLNSEMDLMVAKFSKSDTAIDKNRQVYHQLEKQIEASKQQFVALKNTQEQAKTVVDELRQKHEKAIKAYEDATEAQDGNTKAVKEAEKEMIIAADAVQTAERRYQEWTQKVNEAEIELVNLQKALRDLPDNLQLIGDAMIASGEKFVNVGESLTKYITTPLVAAGTAFVKWSSDFTDGMAKIYTIADESKKPMAEMRSELIQLSNQSGYSLEDLAEAEYQAVSASVDTSKAVEFLTDATKLARGGFTSTTQAVDLLTTVINAYGYKAEDAAYISDVLLRTQNDGKTIIDELAGSMGTVIPTAANYNVSLEQLAAAYATMTKQGVNTARATTFLNAMFTELEKESSAISQILDTKTGKSFAQLMGEGYSLADVLGVLYNAVDGDNEQFQRLFGNIRSGKAASALLTDDFAILNYEVERMADATGQTAYAMEVLETPSLKAKRAIQQLKNSGMELGTTLINELYPYFIKVIDGIKQATEWFASLDDSTKTAIVNMGLIAASAGPLLIAFGKITQGAGAIVKGFGSFSKMLQNYDNAVLGVAGSIEKLSPTMGNAALAFGTALPTILAVGTAYAGIALYAESAMEAERAETLAIWGMSDATRDNIEASREAAVAYAERKLAIQEEQAATAGQVETARILVEEYNNLVDANGKIAEGDLEMASIIQSELASALGMELADVQALVEENGKYGASIEDTMNKILQRAELTAYEELYTEAIKRKAQAEADYKTQVEALEAQHKKTQEAQKLVEQATKNLQDAQARGESNIHSYEIALDDAVNALGAATTEENRLKQAVNDTSQNVDSAVTDANNAADNIRRITGEAMAGTKREITTGGSGVASAARSVKTQAEREFEIDGDTLGYHAVSGFAGALSRYAYMASRAAASMASQAAASARYALSIESPSKVMAEVGKYFDQGFAVGIEGHISDVTQAANMLANSAVGGVQMVGYEPPDTYTRNISAPISIQLTIEGNVNGDDRGFAREIASELSNLISRDREVFA